MGTCGEMSLSLVPKLPRLSQMSSIKRNRRQPHSPAMSWPDVMTLDLVHHRGPLDCPLQHREPGTSTY